MYIRITDRCNMSCAHCGFSCTEKGTDMSREVFVKACEVASDYGYGISLGGGEPTLHPLLFDFIGIGLSVVDVDAHDLFIVTNGSITPVALKLAGMARKGLIAAALSQDEWHDAIDPKVVAAFSTGLANSGGRRYREENSNDHREIRTVRYVAASGRGAEYAGAAQCCFCDDLIVQPNGDLYACGCFTVKFGTVWNPKIHPNYHDGECIKDQILEEQ